MVNANELSPLVTVLASFASTAVVSAGLGVWISKQFDKQRSTFYKAMEVQRISFDDALDKQREVMQTAMEKQHDSFEKKIDAHDLIDQGRHIDNLGRFADLRVILARMGAGVAPTNPGGS